MNHLTLLPRRAVFALALAFASLSLAPAAEARCARPSPASEARHSRYVFEGTVESVSGQSMTFVVTAAWQGAPPARLTVSRSARSAMPSAADVGQSYLVFAEGDDDASLSMSRCGSSGPLSSATGALAALRAAGLTRTAR